MSACDGCPLAHCTQVMDRGPEDAPVVVVGQCPGADELRMGKVFVGPAGKLLVEALVEAGLDPSNILFTNAVRCWDGDKPNAKLIEQCKGMLADTIGRHPRRLIITLGNEACYSLLGGSLGGVTKRHGQITEHQEFGCPIFVSLHPAYILRNLPARDHWVQQLRRAAALLGDGLNQLDDFTLEHTLPACAGGPTVFDLLTDDHWALTAPELAVDIETTGFCYWSDQLLGIGLSTNDRALYITLRHSVEGLGMGLLAGMGGGLVGLSSAEREHLCRWLTKVLGPGRVPRIILHNGKFDARFLHHDLNVDIRPVDFDTMLAHHLCDENSPHGLKQLVQTWLMIHSWEDEAQAAMEAGALAKLPVGSLARYCGTDCVATYRLAQALKQTLETEQCATLYYGLVQPLSDMLLGVELRGLQVDEPLLDELDSRCAEVLVELERRLRDLPGWGDGVRCPWRADQQLKFNRKEPVWQYAICEDGELGEPTSWDAVEEACACLPEQVRDKFIVCRVGEDKWHKVVYGPPPVPEPVLTSQEAAKLGLNPRSHVDLRQVLFGGHPWRLHPTQLTDKTQEPSCAAEALSGLLALPIPESAAEFIRTLLHYNKLNKLHGTFVRGLRGEIAPDGAVHTSYMFNSATEESPRTGRLSSSHPNLQNQPKALRPMFKARDGYTFWESDFCCRADVGVRLADGSSARIGALVRDKNPGPVLSVDEHGNLVSRRIIGWHRAKRNDRRLFSVTYEGYGNHGATVVTEDHPVLTRDRGWVHARELVSGDDYIATEHVDIDSRQRSALIGCLMGDGSIHASSGCFVMDHGHAQRDWVNCKGRLFSNLAHDFYEYAKSYRFASYRHPLWFSERKRWYRDDGSRMIDWEEFGKFFSDLSLAIWYLDDGTCRQLKPYHRPYAEISCAALSHEDVEGLASYLNSSGIECRKAEVWDKRYQVSRPSIIVSATGFGVMRQRISRYVPPSMRYKLGTDDSGLLAAFDPSAYDPPEGKPTFWAPVVVEETTGRRYRNKNGEWRIRPESVVYDITVEDTHNFVTLGGAIHNCQLEVRVWAAVSQDPALLAIFQRSLADPEFDFHREMASVYWGVPVDQVTPEQRQNGKAVTFGIMYGGGADVVVRATGMAREETDTVINRMHSGFPIGQRWFNQTVLHAKQHGYVASPIGRRRRLPDIGAKDDGVRAEAERQSKNSVIQGLASDINNMAALRINSYIRQSGADAYVVNLVHDSILIEVAKEQVEALGPVFKAIMEQEPYTGFGVPLQVEAEVHDHWAGELDVEKIIATGKGG